MEVKYFHGVRKRGKVEILMLAGRTRCEQSRLVQELELRDGEE